MYVHVDTTCNVSLISKLYDPRSLRKVFMVKIRRLSEQSADPRFAQDNPRMVRIRGFAHNMYVCAVSI